MRAVITSPHLRRGLAYVAVVVAVVLGYGRLGTLAHDISQASRNRAGDLCALATSDRLVTRAIVDAGTAATPAPPGASPEVQQEYALGAQRAAQLRQFADALLVAPDCTQIESGKQIAPPPPTTIP